MHYYKKNLGDYYKKAGRLSITQHGAYTLLLDACYDRERFPTESEAIEWAWASTPEEENAVKFVLARFFDLQDDGKYVQTRVYDEIQTYKIGEIQNRLIALSREAKKQNRDLFAEACDQLRGEIKHAPLIKTHEAWTGVVDALIKTHEAPPNQEPITKNQEPVTNNQLKTLTPNPSASGREGYPEDFESIWLLFDNRTGKKNTFANFKKHKPDKNLVEAMRAALTREREHRGSAKAAGSFVARQQDPERWIKNERWNDELPEIEKPRSTSGGFADKNYNEVSEGFSLGFEVAT